MLFMGFGRAHGQKNTWLAQTASIRTLDSLVHAAPTMALRSNDYPHGRIDSLLALPKNLADKSGDSLQLISEIKQLAIHFFEDLAYGNKAPELDFVGVKNSVKDPKLDAKVEAAWAGNSLSLLAKSWAMRSPEISKLFAALADWTPENPWKKSDLMDAIQEQ